MLEHGLKAHVCTVPLRPNDFDWTGHLNNSVLLEICETSRWQWASANKLDLRTERFAAVVASAELRYLRPVSWDPLAHVRVRTDVQELTFYAITIAQAMDSEHGQALATAVFKLALFDFVTRLPVRIRLETLIG